MEVRINQKGTQESLARRSRENVRDPEIECFLKSNVVGTGGQEGWGGHLGTGDRGGCGGSW